MAIVTGFNDSITEKLMSFTGHIHITRFDESHSNSINFSEPVYYDKALVNEIKKIPHVADVAPFTELPVIVQGNGNMEGLKLKGVDQSYRLLSGIDVTGSAIDYSDTEYSKQVILSRATAEKLDINAGDTVQLYFLIDGIPRIRKVRVSGLLHSGLEDVDKIFGLCDIRLLQRINGWSADSINGYQVNLDNEKYADSVSDFIHYNLIQPPLESYTSRENYFNLFSWLSFQKLNGAVLLFIMAIVAIINMGSVLLILMVDRARMIGLLKALGMPFETTRNIFLSIAGLIGTVGVLLGNLLAFALCWIQLQFGVIKLPEGAYSMSYVPVKIIWWQIAVLDVATIVLCVLCMWLPALYIRRIQPAKVLQFK